MNKRLAFTVTAAIACLAAASFVAARSDFAEINWWLIDGGAGRSSASSIILEDSLGQPVVGVASGADVLVSSGFFQETPLDVPAIVGLSLHSIQDNGFAVSWVTDGPTTGRVHWGSTPALGQITEDVRGAGTLSDVHFVVISGLSAMTTYYLDVESGSVVANNGGAHYTVTTGPALPPRSLDPITGRVVLSDNATGKPGAAVNLVLQKSNGSDILEHSAPVMTLSGLDGWWSIDLGSIRVQDGTSYFEYSLGDSLVLFAEGGNSGQDFRIGSVGSQVPNLVLYQCLWDLDSDNMVTASDLTIAAQAWNTTPGQLGYNGLANLGGSSDITILDIMLLAAHWNQTCS